MSDLALNPLGGATEILSSLDNLSHDANQLELGRQNIAEGRSFALDYLTEYQFDTQIQAEKDQFGSLEKSDQASNELLGREREASASDARTEEMTNLMRDMYLATAKTMIAWKVVDGVGKDTKAMLQTQ